MLEKFKKFIQSINLSGVSTGAVVRGIMVLISIVAFILKLFEVQIPVIDESIVLDVVIALFGTISFLQAYWKNNSFTNAAQEADKVMQEKKVEL